MSEPYDVSIASEIESFSLRPSAQTWLKHLAFLAITLCTATMAGAVYPFGRIADFPPVQLPVWDDLATFVTWAPTLYSYFVVYVAYNLMTDVGQLAYALRFSIPLLTILISHEMGHY